MAHYESNLRMLIVPGTAQDTTTVLAPLEGAADQGRVRLLVPRNPTAHTDLTWQGQSWGAPEDFLASPGPKQ